MKEFVKKNHKSEIYKEDSHNIGEIAKRCPLGDPEGIGTVLEEDNSR